jgi:hypothetical protein
MKNFLFFTAAFFLLLNVTYSQHVPISLFSNNEIYEIDCTPAENFHAIQEGQNVILNWVVFSEYHRFWLYFDGEILVDDTITNTFTHENVPVGIHTYELRNIAINCPNSLETTIQVLGVPEFENIVKIYPNPANGYFFVEGSEMAEIVIYNNIGQQIKTISVIDDITRISTKDFQSGLYFLQIITKKGATSSTKLMIN